MKCKSKIYISFVLIIAIIMQLAMPCFSIDEEFKNNVIKVLHIAEVIDDEANLDKILTRAEFAKMIIKSSPIHSTVSEISSGATCKDVPETNLYANYIKQAVKNAYMFMYIDGSFRPDEPIKYNEVARACLALLGYNNSDFPGAQIEGRNNKFVDLRLDENIDKKSDEAFTKLDAMIAIYNTLKTKMKGQKTLLASSVFPDMVYEIDGKLNADEMIDKKISGPYFLKTGKEIAIPFEFTSDNVYLNGKLIDYSEVQYDLGCYGYIIYYLDMTNKVMYAYSERQDISSPITVQKGYILKTYYSAEDMNIPYRVDISDKSYYIDNEEMKYAFSTGGSFKEDDYIIFISNKYNDVSTAYIKNERELEEEDAIFFNKNGYRIMHKNDDADLYSGSIVNAFKFSDIE